MSEPGESAEARAARLSIWTGPVRPEPLAGGLTNTNFVVEDRGRRFVVRIGDDIAVHGVARRNELAASRAAHAAGIAPEVFHAEAGALVLAYVEGRTLTPADITNPANLPRLVEIIGRCHHEVQAHLRGPGFMFWVFHVVRDYAHTLCDARGRDDRQVALLLQRAERLERAVGPIEIVFGHNDLLAGNFIDDGKRLWLVDWEYAGFNSPLFDLGGLASNSAMSDELREALLEVYFDRPASDELRRRFAAMTAASLLRETMWSMVSEIHSALDFDYRTYTVENLNRFEAAYAAFEALEAT